MDGTITTASYGPEALHDPRVVTLLKLTTVREDPMLTALAPKQSPNVVAATLDDGRVVTERVDDLPGFAGRQPRTACFSLCRWLAADDHRNDAADDLAAPSAFQPSHRAAQ